MTPSRLAEIGNALYGDHWHNQLARDLKVLPRTIRRWAAEAEFIPDGIAVEVAEVCYTRAAQLTTIAREMQK